MKRLLLLAILCLGLVGCSTKAQLVPNLDAGKPILADSFAVGEIVDNSGYLAEEESEAVNLEETMGAALKKALDAEQLEKPDSEYMLKTTVVKYSPGNAFARWLLPGAGSTELKIETAIMDKDGVVLATIPVDRTVAGGGLYTIGAWKYVFDDAAKATVEVLKEVVQASVAKK